LYLISSYKPLLKLLILAALLTLAPFIWAKSVYMTTEQFIQSSFPVKKPTPQVIWLNAALKAEISKFLYRPYRGLRVRYWQQDHRSAWIFDEIGKERPITIGLIINQQKIESIEILTYRESRGAEVRYSMFTNQFKGIELKESVKLSQHIDGITGATLSVKAVKRATTLALYLNQQALGQQPPQEQSFSVTTQ
jgi:hypothetical protein